MTDIPTQVARNRRDARRLAGQFVSVSQEVQQNLRFTKNALAVEVGLEVYTRSLNDSLISGHPDGGQHGSGHGVAGDVRGDWSLVGSSVATSEFTRGGRNAVRDALDGQATGRVAGTVAGVGTSAAQPTDSSLENETGGTFAYSLKDATDTVRARSHYLYAEAGDGNSDPQEFGLESIGGTLMARVTTSSPVPLGASEELRVDLTLRVTGGGSGDSAITDSGREAVADSIRAQGSAAGLAEIAWGTGTPTVDPSATSLANEVFRKDAQRSLDLETIRVSAPQFQFEPASQPHQYTEVGVFDDDGNLFWVVDFSDYPYAKGDDTRFTTQVAFRII